MLDERSSGGRMRHLLFGILLCAFTSVATAADARAPSGDTREKPCRDTAGVAKSESLVKQCLEVSPATHPPCNAANACSLIVDEITRSCAMIDKDAPAFCAEYANGR
jgi:hypothetical protein